MSNNALVPSVVPSPDFYLKTIQKQQDDILEIRNQLSSLWEQHCALWQQSDFLRTVNDRLQQRLDRRENKQAGGAA